MNTISAILDFTRAKHFMMNSVEITKHPAHQLQIAPRVPADHMLIGIVNGSTSFSVASLSKSHYSSETANECLMAKDLLGRTFEGGGFGGSKSGNRCIRQKTRDQQNSNETG